MDARVKLEGEDKNMLRIEWRGMSPSVVYNLVNSPVLREDAKPVGFKAIVFTDGGGQRECGSLTKAQCEEKWDYDLERESMIWTPSLL